MTRFLRLGASLYVPATRPDLLAIANRHKQPHARSVIFCTEDALGPDEVRAALDRLAAALPRFEPAGLLRFIRVRDAGVLRTLLGMDGIRRVDGFVLPKVTRHNLDEYLAPFAPGDPFEVMPTLETAEVFDPSEMRALRDLLLQERYRRRVLSLRIGGNDLLQLLGLRRPRARSLYATPLGATVDQLVTTFRPHGFNLTAPVYEYLGRPDVLGREAGEDLDRGLFGKSAIHPAQIPLIEARYRVGRRELEAAERILDPGAPPVFRFGGAMCERATHRGWATLVCQRAALYGVRERDRSIV